MDKKDADRFWDKVMPDSGTECWEWIACTDDDGYGRFNLNRIMVQAHRVSWTEFNGPIPAGLCVLHDCDNPPCVNPVHLFLGTQADNSADMVAKGRQGERPGPGLRGSDHPRAKLIESEVLEIRRLYVIGDVTRQQLADRYGVRSCAISALLRRKTWKHI